MIGLKSVSYSQARSVLDVTGNEAQPKWKFYKEMKDAASEVLDNEVKITMELPLENGSSYTWVLASPQALLRKFIAASLALQSVLRPLLVDNSYSKPLSLVHYHDEVTAGNLLAPIKSRSFTAFRFTFKEFGRRLLTCQQMWFEFAILKGSVIE